MKLKPENYSGLNGIRTNDLCDTGAMLTVRLIAELVEYCTGIVEAIGSNTVPACIRNHIIKLPMSDILVCCHKLLINC